METDKLLMALGDQVGHAKVLEAAKAINADSGYLKEFVEANQGEVPCGSHVGECGECRDGVWYPCI